MLLDDDKGAGLLAGHMGAGLGDHTGSLNEIGSTAFILFAKVGLNMKAFSTDTLQHTSKLRLENDDDGNDSDLQCTGEYVIQQMELEPAGNLADDHDQHDTPKNLNSAGVFKNEQKFIKEAFEKNWIAPLGFNCDAF